MPLTESPKRLRSSKRGRKLSACTECRRRRQKCNGQVPCSNCSRRDASNLCCLVELNRAPQEPPSRGPKHTRSANPVGSPGSRRSDHHLASPSITDATSSLEGVDLEIPLDAPIQSSSMGWLVRNRGVPSFFGHSYFGPDIAAAALCMGTSTHVSSNLDSQGFSPAMSVLEDGTGMSSQLSQVLGMLLHCKPSIDHLVTRFITVLNSELDAIHVITFQRSYDEFWNTPAGSYTTQNIDISWLALLFIVLAHSTHLDVPVPCTVDVKRRTEHLAHRFCWSARRCMDLASSAKGESSDLVRAGILMTRYLIRARKLAEAWLQIGHTSRLAIAQGIHVDGEEWNISRKATEMRRRLWSYVYCLDRMLALALGRPYSISDTQNFTKEPSNIILDDLPDGAAAGVPPKPLTEPTTASLCVYLYRLSKITGRIQEHCFGSRRHDYDATIILDLEVLEWASTLPAYFKTPNPDTSFDNTHPYLPWHRLFLHTSLYFIRTTLHRPFILQSSITDRFSRSRDCCVESACEDLRARLQYCQRHSVEEYKFSLGAHQLYSSAMVLAIVSIKAPLSPQTREILPDIEAYCKDQQSKVWVNACGLAETFLIQRCKQGVEHAIKEDKQTSANALLGDTSAAGMIDTTNSAGHRTDDLEATSKSSSTLSGGDRLPDFNTHTPALGLSQPIGSQNFGMSLSGGIEENGWFTQYSINSDSNEDLSINWQDLSTFFPEAPGLFMPLS